MNYPSATDYHAIIQSPHVAFHDPELKACTVVTTALGTPAVYSGGFALTYFLKSNAGTTWVVRCFRNDSPDREKRYQAIGSFLSTNPAPFFVPAVHQATGIQVAGKWYPLVKMPKVEGETLHKYIERQITQKQDIAQLSQKFRDLVVQMRSLGIAHGDLQHGNIMVSGDRLVLIDYDGLYLPSLQGLTSAESGHESYQHPGRRGKDKYNADLDNFSSIVIYLALRSLALAPQLWQSYSNGDNLLFRSSDFIAPDQSPLLKELEQLTPVRHLVSQFRLLCQTAFEQIPNLEHFLAGDLPFPSAMPFRPAVPYSTVSQYPVLDGADRAAVMHHLGNKVTIVGRITATRSALTRTGAPYVFLNFGDWRQSCLSLVIWSETLNLFSQQGADPTTLDGRWVSVTGLVTSYLPWNRPEQPQIVIDIPSMIESLRGGEVEAKSRLDAARGETRVLHMDVASPPPGGPTDIAVPPVVRTEVIQVEAPESPTVTPKVPSHPLTTEQQISALYVGRRINLNATVPQKLIPQVSTPMLPVPNTPVASTPVPNTPVANTPVANARTSLASSAQVPTPRAPTPQTQHVQPLQPQAAAPKPTLAPMAQTKSNSSQSNRSARSPGTQTHTDVMSAIVFGALMLLGIVGMLLFLWAATGAPPSTPTEFPAIESAVVVVKVGLGHSHSQETGGVFFHRILSMSG
jgi:serine/threonine protein kinase